MENTHKICTKCREELEFSQFHKDKAKKDGLRPICKTCTNAARKKTKIQVASPGVPEGHKHCNSCEAVKPLTAFYKSGTGVRYICMECDNEKRSEIYEAKSGKKKSTQDITKLALALTAVAGIITKKKLCICCNTEKDLEEFRSRARNIDGLSTKCKDCFRREREKVTNEEDLVFIEELEKRQKHFEHLVRSKKTT
jgi:hypothetical protein